MSTTTLTSAIENQCAHCKAPAHRKCGGCSSPLGEEAVATIYYCSEKCQVEHWKLHKSDCKAHQTKNLLYRAGEALQGIFYAFRQEMFNNKIVKVEHKDGKLYLVEGRYPKMRTNLDVLHEFPFKLLPSKEDRHAVLAHMACEDAVAWMQEVTEIFLEGTAQKIEELNVESKNPKREVLIVGPGGEQDHAHYIHSIFKITLRNRGGVYCLDLSGAQFGYYNPVTPWSEYFVNRISSVTSCNPSGTGKALLLGREQDNSLLDLLYRVLEGCSRRTPIAMEAWESKFMPLSTFLRLPQGQVVKEKSIMCYVFRFHYFKFRENIEEQIRKAVENPSVHPVISFIPGN
ncbi:hypothetical protein BELL_0068g00250 [Botrytis elliptica]|uniref:MYND-type domain-containing protein n=1 Tax=Botrytis elliptica TaxID=278938 RepID=A0A4Z1JXZ0_9HELO|nr:hypothetical protein EAE99_004495 [Botrytis elliptica]TGO78398.1 hypothetical protein BELL_0068g00250 [Botrytis elliptica]